MVGFAISLPGYLPARKRRGLPAAARDRHQRSALFLADETKLTGDAELISAFDSGSSTVVAAAIVHIATLIVLGALTRALTAARLAGAFVLASAAGFAGPVIRASI